MSKRTFQIQRLAQAPLSLLGFSAVQGMSVAVLRACERNGISVHDFTDAWSECFDRFEQAIEDDDISTIAGERANIDMVL
jgi:hypothetical protein